MLAIINARWELAAMLVEKGANPNDDGMGFTPLHQLVWAYHPNVVYMPPGPVPTGRLSAMDLAKVLLDHKADPNARMTKNPPDGYRTSMNRIGGTPLLMAARVPDLELMRLLLSYGADPRIKTKDNTTLLIVASGYGWQAGESPEAKPGALMEAVKLALELGGDVHEANDRGYTPLHCAVIRESNELIQFLVDQGADLYAKTAEEDPRTPGLGEGKTPLGVSQGQLINATKKYYPGAGEVPAHDHGPAAGKPVRGLAAVASRIGHVHRHGEMNGRAGQLPKWVFGCVAGLLIVASAARRRRLRGARARSAGAPRAARRRRPARPRPPRPPLPPRSTGTASSCHSDRLKTGGLTLQARGHRPRRRTCRGVGKGRAQASRRRHASVRGTETGCGRHGDVHLLAGSRARSRGGRSPEPGANRDVSSLEPHRVWQRHPRPARPRPRCHRRSCPATSRASGSTTSRAC